MRRVIAGSALLFAAVIVQVTVVDRAPLPGGTGPDIVLLMVVALGLTHGPATGMLAGFLAGLGLDVAPPASDRIGASALVFCLVGYGCGRIGRGLEPSGPRLFPLAVAAAAAGEALQAVVGRILGDPSVTLPAVRQVLPVAVLYDALLCPVVLAIVAVASGRRSGQRPRPAAGGSASGSVPALAGRRGRPPRLRPDRGWYPAPRARPARPAWPVRLPARALRGTGRHR
jgi:rod shape-determining protein MreD